MEIPAAAVMIVTVVLVVLRPRGLPEWVAAGTGLAVVAMLGVAEPTAIAAVVGRTAPVVVFLLAVTVLGRAAEHTGAFDAAALAAGRVARGSGQRLLAAVLLAGLVTTTILSLDATVVLLTPAVIALARRTGAPLLPLALATVYVANTGSLLLPVSNLTNLLVVERLGGSWAFLRSMVLPQAVAFLALWGVLAIWHREALGRPLVPEMPAPRSAVPDRTALVVAVVAVAALLPGVLLLHGWALAGWSSAVAVLAVAGASRIGPTGWLGWVPWRLGMFVLALFALVDASAGPVARLAELALGGGGPVRAGLVGAAVSNLVNNLPAFLLLEDLVADGTPLQGLLIGVNVGPNLMTVGSLATLLWLAILRQHNAAPTSLDYLRWGLVVTPATLLPALLVAAWSG
ncbi:MAG: SLC13 family permease [Acidimicrobiia bacterium]